MCQNRIGGYSEEAHRNTVFNGGRGIDTRGFRRGGLSRKKGGTTNTRPLTILNIQPPEKGGMYKKRGGRHKESGLQGKSTWGEGCETGSGGEGWLRGYNPSKNTVDGEGERGKGSCLIRSIGGRP